MNARPRCLRPVDANSQNPQHVCTAWVHAVSGCRSHAPVAHLHDVSRHAGVCVHEQRKYHQDTGPLGLKVPSSRAVGVVPVAAVYISQSLGEA